MSAMCFTVCRPLVRTVLFVIGAILIFSFANASQCMTLDLDEYGNVDRADFLEAVAPLVGDLVFVRGRVTVRQLSYPEASHIPGNAQAEVFPCENDPFRVPLDEFPTRERIQAGLRPTPWYFAAKFVGYGDDLIRSVDIEKSYESRYPVKHFEYFDVHDKCVTMLAEVTGENLIESVFLAGTLYIHNIYDTESSLGEE